jgi:hypothetical protein
MLTAMPAAASRTSDAPAERYRLRAVELFRIGTHKSKDYTRRDLDDMVKNFARHCVGAKAKMRIPAVIGHAEDTGVPAAGWCSRLYRDGDVLKGDFEDVSPSMARMIKRKTYRKVSAEIYPHPGKAGLDGDEDDGMMARRFALRQGS